MWGVCGVGCWVVPSLLIKTCGFCGSTDGSCSVTLKKGKVHGTRSTLTVSTDSVCPLLYSSMSYGAATGPKSTCRNVPVSCPHCPKWLWSYGYLAHIESQHGENMVDALIEEHAISTTEFEAVLKAEVDGRTARAAKKRKEESMLDKLKAELAAMRAEKQPTSKFWSKIMAPS